MTTDQAAGLLTQAKARYDTATREADQARSALHDTVRQVAPTMRQAEIARITGWTREYIRRIVERGADK